MANYSSFSPNAIAGATNYYPTINLVADDALTELDIVLKDSNTKHASAAVLDPSDSATWAIIDLDATTTVVTMKMRKVNTTDIIRSIICTIVPPVTDGHVIMSWGLSGLAGLEGEYEAELEIAYATGKIMTVQDILRFNVRADF